MKSAGLHAQRQGDAEMCLPARRAERLGRIEETGVDVLNRPEQRERRHRDDVVEQPAADEYQHPCAAPPAIPLHRKVIDESPADLTGDSARSA